MMGINILETVSFSHSKSSNKKNQDAVLLPILLEDSIYCALADGVGGNYGGEIASNIAIDTIRNTLILHKNCTIKSLFDKVTCQIDEFARLNSEYEKMATTLVITKISSEGIEIGYIGDSRVYSIQDNSIIKETVDHTKKEELICNGIFTRMELKGHNSENILTKSIRPFKKNNYDFFKLPHTTGKLLLMSDGVYSFLENKRIIGNDGSTNLLLICSNIKKRIIKKGPKDDYSLVGLSYENITNI